MDWVAFARRGVAGSSRILANSSSARLGRAVTSLFPLQFQKQLRLIEARRLMMSEALSASSTAFAVGYESVPQFTRDYHRTSGRPPARDVSAAKEPAAVAYRGAPKRCRHARVPARSSLPVAKRGYARCAGGSTRADVRRRAYCLESGLAARIARCRSPVPAPPASRTVTGFAAREKAL